MLELLDKDVKATIIKVLQQIIKNSLVANGRKKNLCKEIEDIYKKNKMEILELKYTVTKMKNSLNSVA